MPLWSRKHDRDVATVEAAPAEQRNWYLRDPASVTLFGGSVNHSGEPVSESSMLSLSAVYRALAVISQAGGTLPLKSYRDVDGRRQRVPSFIETNPAGPDSLLTPFQWKEMVFLHLLVQGEADLFHVRNEGGQLVGLTPIHPSQVAVVEDDSVRGGERYTVQLGNSSDARNLRLTPFGDTREDPGMTRIVGPRTRGLRGWSPLKMAGTSLGIGLAAERATANLFSKGAMIQGVLTPDIGEEFNEGDAEDIRSDLDQHLYGTDNAGKIPLVNRILKFVTWQMNNVDAQFLENRQFQIEEIARWFGVPPYMLMQLDKQTSWGTGLAENNRQFAQYVLLSWCKRVEEKLATLLPQPRWVEFDLAGLEAGSAKEEIDLLMAQVNGGFLTLNEARKIRNLEPLESGDALRVPSGVMLMDQLEASAAATEAGTEADAAAGADEGNPDGTA